MKLMTFNLHQYYELNRINTLFNIAQKIDELDLDVVCLQEVAEFEYDYSSEKATNTALIIYNILINHFQKDYYLSLNMFKMGFPYNREGTAIISKHKFTEERTKLVSNTTDYFNFEKREIQLNSIDYYGREFLIVNGHYSWDNENESFLSQLKIIENEVGTTPCFLLGDFNNEYQSTNYKAITKNFKDISCPELLETETFNYDGDKRRIDFVFTNVDYELIDHQRLFVNPMLSDHYGVYVNVKL